MTKLEFETTFGISRGQMNRLVEKAFENGGKFLLPGHGEFTVAKGPRSNSRIEIQPVKSAGAKRGRPPKSAPPPPAESPTVPDLIAEARQSVRPVLETLDAEDLNREKKMAEIRKLWQQTDDGKSEIRSEYRAECIAAFAKVISVLKAALFSMDLSEDQKAKFRAAADEALSMLEEL